MSTLKPNRILIIIVAWLLGGSPPLYADAAPPHPITRSAWTIDSFLEDSRLAGRFIFTLDFDDSGTAWIATSAGLVAYDGYTWRRLTVGDGLPSDFVRCATVAGDGRIWVGTDKGIAILDGVRFIPFPHGAQLAGPNVRRIVEDPDGTMWVCSDNWLHPDLPAGLTAVRGGECTVYREADGLPSDYVSDYFRDARGRQFVLTREGLAQWRDGRWTTPLADLGLAGHDQYMWSIVEAPSVGVLVATQECFFRLHGERWTRIPNDDPGLTYAKLAVTAAGEVLTVPDQDAKAFQKWTGAGFEDVTEPVRRPGSVEYVREAPDGSMWAVGMDVVLRWSRATSEWTEYAALPPPQLVDARGGVWFADTSVVRYADDRFETVPMPAGRLFPDEDGAVWGRDDVEVTRYRDGLVTRFLLPDTGLARVRSGSFGVAAGRWLIGWDADGALAVARFDGERWDASRLPVDANESDRILIERGGGEAFVCVERLPRGPNYLIRLNGGEPEVMDGPHQAALTQGNLHVDAGGRPWHFGEAGAFFRGAGGWEPVTTLGGRFVLAMFDDGSDRWFVHSGLSGGSSGVTRLRDGVATNFAIPVTRIVSGDRRSGIFFTGAWGLMRPPSISAGVPLPLAVPVDDSVDAAVWAPDGSVWLSAGDRVLRFRPDGVPPQTKLVAAEREITTGQRFRVAIEGRERFRPQATGSFTGSWRFDDGPWTAFSRLESDGLPVDLPTGRHRLEVRVRDEGLDVDPTPARLAFEILPIPLAQRAWFWPAAIGGFTGVVMFGIFALVSRIRVRTYATRLEHMVRARTATLRASEERFRRLVEYAKDAFFLFDEQGSIVEVNNEACVSLGDERDALMGRRISDVDAHWSERAIAEMLPRLHSGDAIRTESEHRRRDGSTFPVESHTGLLEVGDRTLILSLVRDITERKRVERRYRRMVAELDHRVKNNLANVIALTNQTLAQSDTLEAFRESFTGRIHAMARVHEALARDRWQSFELGEAIRRTLEPYMREEPSPVTITGDPVRLAPHVASPLGLVLHELATNAAKHGALSRADGRLDIKWSCGEGHALVSWIERGGPPPEAPAASAPGLGLRLLRGLFEHEIRGALDLRLERSGLACTLSIPLPTRSVDRPTGELPAGDRLRSGGYSD